MVRAWARGCGAASESRAAGRTSAPPCRASAPDAAAGRRRATAYCAATARSLRGPSLRTCRENPSTRTGRGTRAWPTRAGSRSPRRAG
eukprot:1978521-Prymnesium_polylepis.1